MYHPRVPTLLLGVGGIGSQVVESAYSSLSSHDKQYIAAVCLDTNTNDLSKLEGRIPHIQTSEPISVLDYLNSKGDARAWYPENPFLLNRVLTAGAGQVRANSRLAFEAAVDAGKMKILHSAIDSINRVNGANLKESLRVMVVCSIAGGTGAGLFMQLPFYVREYLRSINQENVIVRGLFLSPDIVEYKQTNEFNAEAIYVNAYACLKELKAFYGAQTKPADSVLFELPYYRKHTPDADAAPDAVTPVNEIPYDYAFILERVTRSGKNIGLLPDYIRMAMNIVRMQLLSPMSDDIHSIEDNHIISVVHTNGLSRFGSAAVSKAVYPYESIKEYCALRWATESVSEFWSVIDESFTVDHSLREQERLVDPTLPELARSEHFVEKFRSLVTNASSANVFAALRGEIQTAVRSEMDETVTYNDTDIEFVNSVQQYVEATIMTDEITAASEACAVASEKLKRSADAAKKEFKRVYDAVTYYDDLIIRTINQKYFVAVDRIVSAHNNNLEGEAEVSIASILKNVHPLCARYLLYRIREQINELYINNRELAAGCDRKVLISEDFNRNAAGTQTAQQAIAQNKPTALYPYIKIGSGGFIELTGRFVQFAVAQRTALDTFCIAKFSERVYKEVLKRIDSLIELYEMFFDCIPKIIETKKARIEHLYTRHNGEQDHATCYTYADSEAKEEIFRRLRNELRISPGSLDDEIKLSIFNEIYNSFSIGLQVSTTMSEEEQDIRKAGFSALMTEIFDVSVIGNLVDTVGDKGDKVIDLDIMSAIRAHIVAHRPAEERRDAHGRIIDATEDEVRIFLIDIMNRADPFLSSTAIGKPSLMCYWGIHSAAIPTDPDHPDRPDLAYAEKLFDLGQPLIGSPMPDDAFDKHELVCYQGLYNIESDNLKKFNETSHARKCYDRRVSTILGLCRNPFDSVDHNQARVNPHIDRRWVEPAYIPPLATSEELAFAGKQRLATLLSLALNRCYLAELDQQTVWVYMSRSSFTYKVVQIDGVNIAPTYSALLRSFAHNSFMLYDVLDYAETVKKLSVDESLASVGRTELLEHSIIKALMGKAFAAEEEEPETAVAIGDMDDKLLRENALAVIYMIYKQTGSNQKLLEGLLQTLSGYVWSYCTSLIRTKNTAKSTYKAIFKEMYALSGIEALSSDVLDEITKSAFRKLSDTVPVQ